MRKRDWLYEYKNELGINVLMKYSGWFADCLQIKCLLIYVWRNIIWWMKFGAPFINNYMSEVINYELQEWQR